MNWSAKRNARRRKRLTIHQQLRRQLPWVCYRGRWFGTVFPINPQKCAFVFSATGGEGVAVNDG